MATVKEFTPVLMYVDHEKIDITMKSAKNFGEKINDMFRVVESFLNLNIGDEELLRLAKEGIRFVDEKLEAEKFQFSNASKEFNLQSLGLTEQYDELRKILAVSPNWMNTYDFKIINGSAELSENDKTSIVEINTHYTKNAAQTEAFKLAEKLVKNLNKAREREWITRYDVEQVKRSIKIINSAGGKFIPHYYNILSMTGTGALITGY